MQSIFAQPFEVDGADEGVAVTGIYAAGSDVIKIGLIGCGGRGSGAADNAMNVWGRDMTVQIHLREFRRDSRSIGLLAELQTRTYHEAQNKPIYPAAMKTMKQDCLWKKWDANYSVIWAKFSLIWKPCAPGRGVPW